MDVNANIENMNSIPRLAFYNLRRYHSMHDEAKL